MLVAFQALAREAETAPSAASSPHPIPTTSRVSSMFGRFIGDSAAKLNSQIKGANAALGDIGNQTTDAAKDAVGGARNAAGTIIGLPNARIVTGRERCSTAPNRGARLPRGGCGVPRQRFCVRPESRHSVRAEVSGPRVALRSFPGRGRVLARDVRDPRGMPVALRCRPRARGLLCSQRSSSWRGA
jgi:type IV secretory pathway TrbL component